MPSPTVCPPWAAEKKRWRVPFCFSGHSHFRIFKQVSSMIGRVFVVHAADSGAVGRFKTATRESGRDGDCEKRGKGTTAVRIAKSREVVQTEPWKMRNQKLVRRLGGARGGGGRGGGGGPHLRQEVCPNAPHPKKRTGGRAGGPRGIHPLRGLTECRGTCPPRWGDERKATEWHGFPGGRTPRSPPRGSLIGLPPGVLRAARRHYGVPHASLPRSGRAFPCPRWANSISPPKSRLARDQGASVGPPHPRGPNNKRA